MGYHLLLLVYEKSDDAANGTSILHFRRCALVDKGRTADFTLTKMLRRALEEGANNEDIAAILSDRNLPLDEIGLDLLVQEILQTPPPQGYLTISNALQWRLQYARVVEMTEEVEGITRVV